MQNEIRLPSLLSTLSSEQYCYLTTCGRKTGKPHEIEIWFGIQGDSLYLLAAEGHKSDWVKNLLHDPNVSIQIKDTFFSGIARLVNDPEEEWNARHLLAAKYQGWRVGRALSAWGRSALVVAIDLKLAPC